MKAVRILINHQQEMFRARHHQFYTSRNLHSLEVMVILAKEKLKHCADEKTDRAKSFREIVWHHMNLYNPDRHSHHTHREHTMNQCIRLHPC